MSEHFLEQFDPAPKPKKKKVRQFAAGSPELREMLEDARHSGFDAGYAEGRKVAETELAQAAMTLASQVGQAVHALDNERAALRAEFGAAFESTLRALLPPLAEQTFPQLVRAYLEKRLAQYPGALTLRAAPDFCETLRAFLEHVEETGRLAVIPDERMAPLRAQIAWDHGVSELDLGAACAKAFGLLDDPDAGGAPAAAAAKADPAAAAAKGAKGDKENDR